MKSTLERIVVFLGHALELNSTTTAFVLLMEIALVKMNAIVTMVILVGNAIFHSALISEVTIHLFVRVMDIAPNQIYVNAHQDIQEVNVQLFVLVLVSILLRRRYVHGMEIVWIKTCAIAVKDILHSIVNFQYALEHPATKQQYVQVKETVHSLILASAMMDTQMQNVQL